MEIKEHLMNLLISAKKEDPETIPFSEFLVDYLVKNGVTIAPAVPGPSEADPNIMELCFRNGENHMREKIKTSLLKLSADIPCVTISQVLKFMEDL